MRIDSIERFQEIQTSLTAEAEKKTNMVLVCCGPGCLANGAAALLDAFRECLDGEGDGRTTPLLKGTGCHGLCSAGPMVILEPKGILYSQVKPSQAGQIVDKTIKNGEIIEKLLYKEPGNGRAYENWRDIPFYKGQMRVSMRNLGKIDPLQTLNQTS